jgi:dTMP kinase
LSPYPLTQAYFFAFEGLDGSGKTTQARLLADRLGSALGEIPLLLSEPSLGPAGQEIRERVFRPGAALDPREELRLFLADRAWDVENNILPALRQGRHVIIDRYSLSSVAYQGATGLISQEEIMEANLGFPKPKLTFLLELSPAEAMGRVASRSSRRDNYETEEYLARVKGIYDSIKDETLIRLPAMDPEAITHGHVLAAIERQCPGLVTGLGQARP